MQSQCPSKICTITYMNTLRGQLKPTHLDRETVIRGRVKEVKDRKVVVETTVYAAGVATARGEVVSVKMSDSFGQNPTQKEAP